MKRIRQHLRARRRAGSAARASGATRILTSLLLLAIPSAAPRADFYLTPDVPADLGGATYLPWDIVRNDGGIYTLSLSLPPGTPVDALHRSRFGELTFSVGAPTDLGGVTYDPRDIILRDGMGSFFLFLGGAAAGIPEGSNLDALAFVEGEPDGLLLSFDVPTTIGGETFDPADLVRFGECGFCLYFDASAVTPPIPVTTNLIGAEHVGGLTMLSFDVATTLGGATYLPGEIVSWDGASFASVTLDPAWPPGSELNALALGTCPDGDGDGYGFRADPACAGGAALDCDDADAGVFAPPAAVAGLDVLEIPGGFRFTWTSQAATAGPATVYDAYSGLVSTLGPGGDFSAGACAGDGLTMPSFDDTRPPPPLGDARYLVFRAQNPCGTGTYGTPGRDAGAAASASPCL